MAAFRLLDRILIYVDATEGGVAATRYAIALAKTCEAEVHAVYVVNEKMLGALRHARVFLESEERDLRRDLEQDGMRYLQRVERMAREKGLTVALHLRKGTVHEEVVGVAGEVDASLIVLGELEEPLSIRDSFCNEAEMVMWTSKRPVLIVKGAATAKQAFDAV